MPIERKAGDRYGVSDADPPEVNSDYILSRVLDALDASPDPDTRGVYWLTLPRPLRTELHFSRWSYLPPDPLHPDHEMSRRYTRPPTPMVVDAAPPTRERRARPRPPSPRPPSLVD